ncbi:hypothetical protein TorRG33x02_010480 [Trema orientale]|uniref:Uncharacterized protein n=1 Tax=Trema orientale TaxID=63057 RepID=A0A2P5FYZ5_TREOI|nr:hypothetical protein TorRG33x02_010480 [Trema orientale]
MLSLNKRRYKIPEIQKLMKNSREPHQTLALMKISPPSTKVAQQRTNHVSHFLWNVFVNIHFVKGQKKDVTEQKIPCHLDDLMDIVIVKNEYLHPPIPCYCYGVKKQFHLVILSCSCGLGIHFYLVIPRC